MTSNSSTLMKCPPKNTRLLLSEIFKSCPDRTIQKGQILKDTLVWAKLWAKLFHVDGSHAGPSPYYYHIQLIQRCNNTVINGNHHYFYFHKQSKVSLGKYMRVHLTFDWHVYFSWPICFFRTLVCGLFINLLFPGRRYFKVPLPILLAASPLACRPQH